MKKLLFGLIILGLTIQTYAQVTKVEKLSEVVIAATNYKYLTNVGIENPSVPVTKLEQKVANYDLKSSEIYNDEYDEYTVSFHIPVGTILAAYDKDGNLLRTIERFTNIVLPREVLESVAIEYPNWIFDKTVYLVNYHDNKNTTKKYKIRLKKGDETIRIKCDAYGNFL